MGDLIPVETIADKIYLIRKQKVMLNRDPAESVRRGDRSTEESWIMKWKLNTAK